MAERYFTLINIILITVFVAISTGTFYKVITQSMVIQDVQSSKKVTRKSMNPGTFKKQSLASYSQVARRNLFKVDSDDASKSSTDELKLEDMEKTELQLTLWGTIAGGDTFAWAIIEEKKTREQALYKVGDTIQDGVLTHVLRNKVVLNVNGKDQILEVDDDGRQSTGPRRSPGPMRDFADQGGDGPANKITVEREMIDESLKDLNNLMKDVRIRPHFKDGEADGLIISGIRGDSVFKKLGLRNGDIILGVDGSKIESVDDAMKLYGGLKNMENMKVEIKRRGQVQTLDFDIK
ncbi:MAG: PDZ domain-containing protein [Proteobacteria bacterium]|nr:PDZ domain-containing protein [Pseudomonadota bacterium]